MAANAMSIPAETPDDVKNLPSSTHRALATQSTFGASGTVALKSILFVVALRPSRTPETPSRTDPVQTAITSSARAEVFAIQSVIAGFSHAIRAVSPPGTSNRS